MALKNVNPGDLITAADWNDLVGMLNTLDTRLSELEKGGPKTAPRITQVLPTGIVMEGDQIRIYGTNFGYTQGVHSLFFGNTRASSFLAGSSDSLLIVQIPDNIEGASEVGTALTMSVGNQYGFTTRALTVKAKPAVISGGFQFTYNGSSPATPTPNTTVLYNFELKSFASQNVIITVTPNIQIIPPLPDGVADPGLARFLTVVDANGSTRTDRQIALAEGSVQKITLRLSIPDNTNGLRYSLTVTASAPGVPPVVESLPDQQVGQASEQPDPTISAFEFSSIVPQGQGSFSTDSGGISGVHGTLTIKQSATVTIDMRTVFSFSTGITNNYELAAIVQAPVNGWSASVSPIVKNPLPIQGPGGGVDTFFEISAPASTSTAIVQLMLTRQGATTSNKRAVSYRLITTP